MRAFLERRPAAFVDVMMGLLSLGSWNTATEREARAMGIAQRRVHQTAVPVLMAAMVPGGGWYRPRPNLDLFQEYGATAV
jgi:hypothetical protein